MVAQCSYLIGVTVNLAYVNILRLLLRIMGKKQCERILNYGDTLHETKIPIRKQLSSFV